MIGFSPATPRIGRSGAPHLQQVARVHRAPSVLQLFEHRQRRVQQRARVLQLAVARLLIQSLPRLLALTASRNHLDVHIVISLSFSLR